jgi:four helix bundle protein
MRDFRELKVWEKSHHLTLAIYRATTDFPRDEIYGLTSQMRRSSSIPANIAEACGRGTNAEFARFLQIALVSASELAYQLVLSRDLNFLQPTDHELLTNEVVEIKRMLTSFIQKLRADG